MIVGLLADVDAQKSALPAAVVRALEALQKVDLRTQAPGRYDLEGDKLFYLLQDVTLKALEDTRAEAHQRYADIQIPITDSECFGFSVPQADLAPSEDLFADKDLAFYPNPANESFIDINPGGYVVFFPKELHRPCLAIQNKSSLRKVVVKIHASLLGL